jgi:hypothetical protein
MSSLNQIITVQIDRNTTTPTQVGFGTPLLLGYFPTSIFPERVRTYSTLAELEDDGFATTHPIYLAAADLLAQNPSPPEFKVGRRALAFTQSVDITPTDTTAGTLSEITIAGPGDTAGETFECVIGKQGVLTLSGNVSNNDTVTLGDEVYTFKTALTPAANEVLIGGSASASIDNLIEAINDGFVTGSTTVGTGTDANEKVSAFAGSGDTMLVRAKAGYTSSTLASTETGANTSFGAATLSADTVATIIDWYVALIGASALEVTETDGTTKLDIDGTDAGDLFFFTLSDDLTFVDNTPDPGIATDLAAVNLYDNDWYCLLIDSNSAAEIAAAAAWVQSNTKIFVCQTMDSTVASTTNAADTSSIADTLEDASYDRTMMFYHKTGGEYVAAAMAGRALPETPGSITWAYKQLSSVSSQDLTTNEMSNLEDKNVNFLSTLAGVAITRYGTSMEGEYMDVMRGTDHLAARIQERVYTLLVNSDKLSYTDKGIQAVRGEILAQLQVGVSNGFLASDPEPTCTVPRAVDVSAADKAARTLNDVTFRATLAGAIHRVAIEGELNL